MNYEFFESLKEVLNSGQSRSLMLHGNIDDLFFDGKNYVPLIEFLATRCNAPKPKDRKGIIQVIYEVNKPIRLYGNDQHVLVKAWEEFKGAKSPDADLNALFARSYSNATVGMETLRQLTVCSRNFLKSHDLLITIERAEIHLPNTKLNTMAHSDRMRCAIVHDWFSDPEFVAGNDSVVMVTESPEEIHPLVSRLPQTMELEIPYPTFENRQHYLTLNAVENIDSIARQTAGLSIYALRQLVASRKFDRRSIVSKVEQFIQSQLGGDDTVEFHRPEHTLEDCVGFRVIKRFLVEELIPRLNDPEIALAGAAVAGPIGGGKTFIMEGFAAMVDRPVIVLKNIRSKWYGETGKITQRLRRLLFALGGAVIFQDEADTAFGGLSADTHETERRLTTDIQSIMSDVRLLGKVFWLLMTARIEMLSPDLRREGRAGDLIIPILDPEGEDREDFIRWTLSGAKNLEPTEEVISKVREYTKDYSSAAFAKLRSEIKAKKCKSLDEVVAVIYDIIPSDIAVVRKRQTLQALLNTTRRSLLPEAYQKADIQELKKKWRDELLSLQD